MFYKHIANQYLKIAITYPQNSAFCINNKYYSYSQLTERIVNIAESLKNNREQYIALVTNDDLETYASIFAIWLTGKAYVPLNPSTPSERNLNILRQVGTNTILDSKFQLNASFLDDIESLSILKSYILNPYFDNQAAYIFFTSGSTGIPKGVVVTKKNIASFVESFNNLNYDITCSDRFLQMFELTFDLSVMSFLIPLLHGACVYTIPRNRIKYSYIYELMDEKSLTIALMVPSILNYLRPYFSEIRCTQMRYSLFCGEALNEQIVDEWSKCVPNARIENVYGPTENTIFCTSYTYKKKTTNDSCNGILSIGKPMLNTLAVIFNSEGQEAKINETGELCLAGNQLTPGYFNNPTLNKSMFFSITHNGDSTRFYKTGDLCALTSSGNINYLGRKDSQVKIQGFRIELPEIEYHIKRAIDNRIELIALAVENSTGNNEIAIIFESENFKVDRLKNHLQSIVPSYMVPSQYYFIKPFPLNVNGKIDRKKIKKIITQ